MTPIIISLSLLVALVIILLCAIVNLTKQIRQLETKSEQDDIRLSIANVAINKLMENKK